MKRIAPELDQLMWTLVEGGNDRAIEEFALRHPELRAELMRRAVMVGTLRKAKPATITAPTPPPFRPRTAPAPLPPSRWLYVAAGVGIATLGVASFIAGRYVLPATPTMNSTVEMPPQPIAAKVTTPDPIPMIRPNPVPNDPGEVASAQESDPPAVTPTITLKVASAPLYSVLAIIGSESHVKVIPAPGLSNPTVEAEYANLTAMQILEDLGRRHEFTAFDQGDGSIIIVPAVQRDEPNRTRLGG